MAEQSPLLCRPNRPEDNQTMRDNRILMLVFLSVAINQLWYIMPDSAPRDYFPFADMELSLQMHVYFACQYISTMFLLRALFLLLPTYSKSFAVFIILEAICFVQYLLCYGQSFLPGVDMNTVKLIVYGLILFHNMLKNSVNYVKTS